MSAIEVKQSPDSSGPSSSSDSLNSDILSKAEVIQTAASVDAKVSTQWIHHLESCILIIVDDDEEESESNIFIVPQKEVTVRMRQLFLKTFHLKDVKDLTDCEHREFEQILDRLNKYKVAYKSNPSGPPQLIVERIRARY